MRPNGEESERKCWKARAIQGRGEFVSTRNGSLADTIFARHGEQRNLIAAVTDKSGATLLRPIAQLSRPRVPPSLAEKCRDGYVTSRERTPIRQTPPISVTQFSAVQMAKVRPNVSPQTRMKRSIILEGWRLIAGAASNDATLSEGVT